MAESRTTQTADFDPKPSVPWIIRVRTTCASTQFAAAQIRDGISNGKYGPGEKLWQDQLAKELNISRIPVREALCTLASEGLVTLLPNRGATVPHLSSEELEELYALGASLESMAAKRAVARLQADDLRRMRSLIHDMRKCHDKRTPGTRSTATFTPAS